MPMLPCSGCDRFIVQSQRQCPFCGTAIRLSSSPIGGFAGVLLGLSLAACTPDPGDDDGNSTVADTNTDASATGTTSVDDVGEAETTAYGGPGSFTDTTPPDDGTTVTDTEEAEVTAYGGPPPDSSTTSPDSDTEGTDTSSTSTGGSGSTG